MGEYTFFIWSAYGVAGGVMGLMLAAALRQRRRALRAARTHGLS